MNEHASLTDLADASQITEITAYARQAATELIVTCVNEGGFLYRCPQRISADQLESATFTNLPCDPELMHLLIETVICERLDCSPDDICADF